MERNAKNNLIYTLENCLTAKEENIFPIIQNLTWVSLETLGARSSFGVRGTAT